MISAFETISYSIIGGLLPAVIWLFFWIREDRIHPEPLKKIIWSFAAGAAMVVVVLPLERWSLVFAGAGVSTIVIWALIEELAKLGAAMLIVFHKKFFDEPIDALIYLISAALGFAAAENIFFLLTPLTHGALGTAILTGNIRFIGASLLHVVASATIGAGLAFSWYKKAGAKWINLILGIVTATLLHAFFNFFILRIKGAGVFVVFFFVWISVAVLLAIFESVKRMHPPEKYKTFNKF